jgi:hypothetical protein
MDAMREEEGDGSGPGVDEVMMQLLEMLAQKRRGSRAESVLKPAPPAMQGEEQESPSEENEMGSLEEMLSDPELSKKVEDEEE